MAQYYREWNDTFVNPYNFVSVNRRSKNRIDVKHQYTESEKLHTGYLQCKILVKTPLAIPDTEKKETELIPDSKEKKHSSYSFYTINGRPAIPGSSIRGVLRSVYEAVTDSCMVTVRDEMGLTARVNNRKPYFPGLLVKENGEWKLYEAKRYLIPIDGDGYRKFRNIEAGFKIEKHLGKRYIKNKNGESFQNGKCVEFKLYSENQPYQKNGFTVWDGIVKELCASEKGNAYVYVGEGFSKKHGESLFQKGAVVKAKPETIQHSMEGLLETIKVYRDSAINRNYDKEHSGYANYEEAKEKGVIPIWYKNDEGFLYFSAASIGRMQYENRLIDLIGSKKPCKKRESVCKACALFGMAKAQEAIGSRVRVSDALAGRDHYEIQRATLKELGMPRNSYMPFYAEKEGIRKPVSCRSYDETGAGIRGRKFYWHNPRAEKDAAVYTTTEKTERNATFDLIMPGAEFTFKIYYDEITQQQLDELIWTITFWENEESGIMCHKLGHGKPLGLGSVKIVVMDKVERSIASGSYQLNHSEVLPEKIPVKEGNQAVREILKICNFNTLQDKDICYPYVVLDEEAKYELEHNYSDRELKDNVLANHQWFTQNKGTKRGSEEPCRIAPILEEEQRLPVYYVRNLDNRKDFKPQRRNHQCADINSDLQKVIGTVKFFNKEKNFGFIRRDDGEEFFVHGRSIDEGSLFRMTAGVKVEFTVVEGRRGLEAGMCKMIEL